MIKLTEKEALSQAMADLNRDFQKGLISPYLYNHYKFSISLKLSTKNGTFAKADHTPLKTKTDPPLNPKNHKRLNFHEWMEREKELEPLWEVARRETRVKPRTEQQIVHDLERMLALKQISHEEFLRGLSVLKHYKGRGK